MATLANFIPRNLEPEPLGGTSGVVFGLGKRLRSERSGSMSYPRLHRLPMLVSNWWLPGLAFHGGEWVQKEMLLTPCKLN